jgi:hypothetical protein
MATLPLPSVIPAHLHSARRLHFTAGSDGLLIWLGEEFWGRGLFRLAKLLDDLRTERQAEQPVQPLDPGLEGLCPSEGRGLCPFPRGSRGPQPTISRHEKGWYLTQEVRWGGEDRRKECFLAARPSRSHVLMQQAHSFHTSYRSRLLGRSEG